MSIRLRARGTAAGPTADRGQSTVEAALLLPAIAVVLLAVIQVGLVVHARIMVTHAAREGARAAAVGGTDDDVERAVAVAGDLAPYRLEVEVRRRNGRAVVEVSYDEPTSVPIIGLLLNDVTLEAEATMRLE